MFTGKRVLNESPDEILYDKMRAEVKRIEKVYYSKERNLEHVIEALEWLTITFARIGDGTDFISYINFRFDTEVLNKDVGPDLLANLKDLNKTIIGYFVKKYKQS